MRADLLHNIYHKILQHLILWIVLFLKGSGCLDRFHHIWEHLSQYPGFLKPTTVYAQILQWQGKEMKNFGKVISGCLALALYNETWMEATNLQMSGNGLRASDIDSFINMFELQIGNIYTDQKTIQTFE